MSERILRALMQLFAILARVDESEEILNKPKFESTAGRLLVEDFLKTELSKSQIDYYLKIFDEDLQKLHQSSFKKDGKRKRTSVNSVKILRICSQINKELTQRQKILVLIRVIEFILVNQNNSNQEFYFVETVAESFNIEYSVYERIKAFIQNDIENHIDDNQTLFISSQPIELNFSKSIVLPNLDGEIRILRIDSSNTLYFRYLGSSQLLLNGQIISSKRVQTFSTGSSLKTSKSNQLYYSDVISKFLSDEVENKFEFCAENLSYIFPDNSVGLHTMNLKADSGQLVGIMGGSGSGKSTLLNLLNGKLKPSTGNIKINSVDLTLEPEKLEGIIGYISQDDVLFEDLTVYQNLFYNAELCFKDLDSNTIHKKVVKILLDMGLMDIMRLKVGSQAEKIISGGQRKRLNIALELIREPAVLFVDEPTSGLSSRDSENIMDLMKELTLQGKLIFVVIHQPSSEIFKMFDKLLLLDIGGFPIFDGNPIDSIVYFKMHVNHANAELRDCPECGNVNPEQIFNIVESKIVDENGNLTSLRKNEPKEWYEKYRKENKVLSTRKRFKPLKSESKKPDRWKQFTVFTKRDVFSKISNKQYLLVNFLEAPILAILLSFVMRYSGKDSSNKEMVYSFFYNENIPQYILISTIVAVFMGLTVAAEEIFRDRQILKRESFLHLSKSSYLFSKLGILFSISAAQTLTYVLIANSILGIKGMYLEYWLVLFTVSCFANLIGLIISSLFNSVKVIYIAIPLFIIPQILFSGVLVKYDKFHSSLANQKEVPFIGNIVITRWAFEALAVEQQLNNALNKELGELKFLKAESAWKRDYWIPEMKEQISIIENRKSSIEQIRLAKITLKNEIKKEESRWSNFKCDDCFSENNNEGNYLTINYFLSRIRQQYLNQFKKAVDGIDGFVDKVGLEMHNQLENDYVNESLRNLVTNRNEFNKIIHYNGELIQKVDQIYLDTPLNGFFTNQLYTPYKYIFGLRIPTFFANILFLWFLIIPFFFILYFDLLKLKLTRKIV